LFLLASCHKVCRIWETVSSAYVGSFPGLPSATIFTHLPNQSGSLKSLFYAPFRVACSCTWIILCRRSAADVIDTYALNGVVTLGGSTLTGTISVDVTAGDITAIDATYTSAITAQVDTFTTPSFDQGADFFGDGYVAFFTADQGQPNTPGGAQLALLLPYDYLNGYPGSLICAYEYQCNGVISTVYYYDSTQAGLTSSAALCSGGLGVAAVPYDPSTTCVGGSQTVIDNAPATTPEPSSLILLGSGALGMMGVVRRRLRR
jgi:hypothetical protein